MSAVGDGRAEFAVTVRDDWQHKGLGTLLTKHVIEAARQRGINALYSVDASENGPMNGFDQVRHRTRTHFFHHFSPMYFHRSLAQPQIKR